MKCAHGLLEHIWYHEARLNAGPAHDLVGKSSLLVTGINGGGYIAVPGQCRISLIRKLRPGEDFDKAVVSFEAAVNSSEPTEGISVSIDYPAGRDHPKGGSPVEIPCDTEQVSLLQDCIRRVHDGHGRIGGAPYWSETPFLVNELDCPSVYCAPGDIAVAHTFDERIDIQEYLAAIRCFALFIARYCGVNTP